MTPTQVSRIYENAIASIQVGVEDLIRNDNRRDLSAVRNVHAGILLLCKEALRRISPSDEILLAQKLEPRRGENGEVKVFAVGKSTVGADEIKKRFKDFGYTLDWTRLEAISQIRHEIEHSYQRGSREIARQAVADAYLLIAHLLKDILHEEPTNVLGSDCWNALLANKDVFQAELNECQDTLKSVEWVSPTTALAATNFYCPTCQSTLLKQRDPVNKDQMKVELYCCACGIDAELGSVIGETFDGMFAHETYRSVKHGGEGPLGTCPECGEETYILDEAICGACGFEMSDNATCAVCSEPLSLDEYAHCGGLCSYHKYVSEKDD